MQRRCWLRHFRECRPSPRVGARRDTDTKADAAREKGISIDAARTQCRERRSNRIRISSLGTYSLCDRYAIPAIVSTAGDCPPLTCPCPRARLRQFSSYACCVFCFCVPVHLRVPPVSVMSVYRLLPSTCPSSYYSASFTPRHTRTPAQRATRRTPTGSMPSSSKISHLHGWLCRARKE